jgi:hypothetical protein
MQISQVQNYPAAPAFGYGIAIDGRSFKRGYNTTNHFKQKMVLLTHYFIKKRIPYMEELLKDIFVKSGAQSNENFPTIKLSYKHSRKYPPSILVHLDNRANSAKNIEVTGKRHKKQDSIVIRGIINKSGDVHTQYTEQKLFKAVEEKATQGSDINRHLLEVLA